MLNWWQYMRITCSIRIMLQWWVRLLSAANICHFQYSKIGLDGTVFWGLNTKCLYCNSTPIPFLEVNYPLGCRTQQVSAQCYSSSMVVLKCWHSDKFDGLTMHQHSLLHQWIHELIQPSPSNLLPRHRFLLQQDFASLGNSDIIQCQIWVATKESALGANSHYSSGHLTPGSIQRFFQTNLHSHPPQIPHSLPSTKRHQHHHPSHQPCQQNNWNHFG